MTYLSQLLSKYAVIYCSKLWLLSTVINSYKLLLQKLVCLKKKKEKKILGRIWNNLKSSKLKRLECWSVNDFFEHSVRNSACRLVFIECSEFVISVLLWHHVRFPMHLCCMEHLCEEKVVLCTGMCLKLRTIIRQSGGFGFR